MIARKQARAKSMPDLHIKQNRDLELKRKARSIYAPRHLGELNSPVETLLTVVSEIETGRISVLGKAGVGKTALIQLLAFGRFVEAYSPTQSEATIPAFALLRLASSTVQSQRKVSHASGRPQSKRSLRESLHSVGQALAVTDFEAVLASGSRVLGPTSEFLERSAGNLHLVRSMKMILTDCVSDFKVHSPLAYKACIGNSYAFILVVSTDDPGSLVAAREAYADIVHDQRNASRPIVLVVNKCDILDSERKVDYSAIQQLVLSLNVPRVDISCKNSYGVEKLFMNLAALSTQFNKNMAEVREEWLSDEYAFVSEDERESTGLHGKCMIA